MPKIGGRRNFGYGKQMAWAGRQALLDRYGQGHHATVAAHAARWGRFVTRAKAAHGIRDARSVDDKVVSAYGREMVRQVADHRLSVAYAQNLLSTVNVVLEAMRGDRLVRIAPASLVGLRCHMRSDAKVGCDEGAVRQLTAGRFAIRRSRHTAGRTAD